MSWIVPAYFVVGFVIIVAEFAIAGPRKMWAELMDDDPNDDNFGAWFGVIVGFLAWPFLIGMALAAGVMRLVLVVAMRLAMLLRRKESTKPSQTLKPCKCGGEPVFAVDRISSGDTITAWSVLCRNAKCDRFLYTDWWPTREAAVAAWNRRTEEKGGTQ